MRYSYRVGIEGSPFRYGPGEDFPIRALLPAGTVVTSGIPPAGAALRRWLPVSFRGRDGWVANTELTPMEEVADHGGDA